jgi:hypothetical protein
MLDVRLQTEIDALPDEAAVDEVMRACKRRCAAIMGARISALPEFPRMMRTDGEGQPVEVDRQNAISMLLAGSHKVVA